MKTTKFNDFSKKIMKFELFLPRAENYQYSMRHSQGFGGPFRKRCGTFEKTWDLINLMKFTLFMKTCDCH